MIEAIDNARIRKAPIAPCEGSSSSAPKAPAQEVLKRASSQTLTERPSKKRMPEPTNSDEPNDSGEWASFVANPSGAAALSFIRRVPHKIDPKVLSSYSDERAMELLALSVARPMLLLGEIERRWEVAEDKAGETKQSVDETLARHSQWLGDSQKEKAALLKEVEATREELRRSEAKVAELKRKAQVSQLALPIFKEEARNSWLKKEDFLKSAEFEEICSKKVASYFLHGFYGCLAQLRANGYPEETHPARFLDANRALSQMLEQGEASHEPDANRLENPPPTPLSIGRDRGSGS